MLASFLLLKTLFSLVQMFFPLGPVSHAIYGGVGAMIFSAYIVYDTDNLIKRHTYDEYIGASVTLYLDILNLFLSILRILREANN
jgi:protein lifeguard